MSIIYRTNSIPRMVKIFFQIEINSNLISGLKNVTTPQLEQYRQHSEF